MTALERREAIMREALCEARSALARGEIPVGAVIERGGEIEFIYHGKHFSITHFEENGQHKVSVMQAYNYDSEKVYDIAEISNIGEYLLDGQILKNVISDCQITFRCF